jgi:hypothetical protein
MDAHRHLTATSPRAHFAGEIRIGELGARARHAAGEIDQPETVKNARCLPTCPA